MFRINGSTSARATGNKEKVKLAILMFSRMATWSQDKMEANLYSNQHKSCSVEEARRAPGASNAPQDRREDRDGSHRGRIRTRRHEPQAGWSNYQDRGMATV